MVIRNKLCYSSLDSVLVAENKECTGSEIQKNLRNFAHAKVQDCANACHGVSAMFIFNQHSENCFCKTSSKYDGTCLGSVTHLENYDLYKYKGTFKIIPHHPHICIIRISK